MQTSFKKLNLHLCIAKGTLCKGIFRSKPAWCSRH